MNTRGSWQYIEVLWSETIGLCKKLNIIYNIITCNPEPRATRKSNYFLLMGSFGQLVLILWFNSLVHVIMQCTYTQLYNWSTQ